MLTCMQEDDLTQGTTHRERSLKRVASQLGLSQEEKSQADTVDLRCLDLCISMLRRVNSVRPSCTFPFILLLRLPQKFEETSVLEGIVADVILPAVKRKEYSMRQKGMLGLGLCCLLSKVRTLLSARAYFDSPSSQWLPPRYNCSSAKSNQVRTH